MKTIFVTFASFHIANVLPICNQLQLLPTLAIEPINSVLHLDEKTTLECIHDIKKLKKLKLHLTLHLESFRQHNILRKTS